MEMSNINVDLWESGERVYKLLEITQPKIQQT